MIVNLRLLLKIKGLKIEWVFCVRVEKERRERGYQEIVERDYHKQDGDDDDEMIVFMSCPRRALDIRTSGTLTLIKLSLYLCLWSLFPNTSFPPLFLYYYY